jgi:hypothetical protein
MGSAPERFRGPAAGSLSGDRPVAGRSSFLLEIALPPKTCQEGISENLCSLRPQKIRPLELT